MITIKRAELLKSMARKKLTRDALAKAADVSKMTVQRYMSDERAVVTTATLGKLAEALGVDVTEIAEF